MKDLDYVAVIGSRGAFEIFIRMFQVDECKGAAVVSGRTKYVHVSDNEDLAGILWHDRILLYDCDYTRVNLDHLQALMGRFA